MSRSIRVSRASAASCTPPRLTGAGPSGVPSTRQTDLAVRMGQLSLVRRLTRRHAARGLYLRVSGFFRTSGQRPGRNAMRKLGLVATAALLAAFVAVPISEAASQSPFVGSWSSLDPVDGSVQHLDIIGGTNVAMAYVDEFGTVCVNIGAPTVRFSGRLTGHVHGDDLFAWFKEG